MIRLTFALLGAVVAGSIFFLYTQPAYDDIRASQSQIAQYDAALDKAAELQSLKQSLLKTYNTFNPNDLERLQKFLPDHVDNVRLILDLDSLAGRYGLGLQNVDVSNSSSAASGKSQTALGAIAANGQKYDSLTLKFTTHGTYDSFIDFMTDLESSLRVVDLVALSISSSVPGGAGPAGSITRSGPPLYTYDITLRTYWLK